MRGKQAVASSQHPIVTQTMLQVMREGGTAVDAGIAGCLVQATIQQEMTNHTGTVDFVFWEAKTGKAWELNSSGTLVSGLAPFRPLPPNLGVLIPAVPPCACVPGFMPGLKAIHERFGTKPWARLVEPAIHWAEVGHEVSSFEFGVLTEELRGNVYFPAGRELFTPSEWWLRLHYGVSEDSSLWWQRWVQHPLQVARWLTRRATTRMRTRMNAR